MGPAVSLDTRGVRSIGPSPQIHRMEGLKVALPPLGGPKERIIPIQVEGGRSAYQPQSSAAVVPPSSSMARVILDEKVMTVVMR